MKTKIAYVLISGDQDFYFEQCWLSATSLKLQSPHCQIILLTDDETNESKIKKNIDFCSLFQEIKCIPFEESLPQKERSRYLKTTLRQHISGDFLFIDTDTYVLSPIDDIDDVPYDFAAVLETHSPIDEKSHLWNYISKRIVTAFNLSLKGEINYFNSGIILCKDTPANHTFFNEWHKNYKISQSKGVNSDQPSFYYTITKRLTEVNELNGIWNCQVIMGGIRYLRSCKILHYQHTSGFSSISPFFSGEIFLKIKGTKKISEDILKQLPKVDQTITTRLMMIGNDDTNYWFSSPNNFLRKIFYHFPKFYGFLSSVFSTILK